MPTQETDIKIERWEDDEFILNIKGLGVVGSTLSKRDAETVKKWLTVTLNQPNAVFHKEAASQAHSDFIREAREQIIKMPENIDHIHTETRDLFHLVEKNDILFLPFLSPKEEEEK